jgi:hypothetical protein
MSETLPVTNLAARRTTWMAARARNAVRRGWLIAAAGLLAVAGTMAVLILLPREVDRVLRDRISALPALTDTLPLHDNFEAARQWQRQADSSLRVLRTADADRVAIAAQKEITPPVSGTAQPTATAPDAETRRDLALRVSRARSAPLVESYRAVGDAEFLRNDARVRALVDSLNDANRDREAYGALGGADARYAALTTRLTTLGQRLLALAEQRLAADSPGGAATTPRVELPPTPAIPTTPQTGVPAESLAKAATTDTATLAPRAQFNIDSVAERAAQVTFDSASLQLVRSGQTLERARQANLEVLRQQDEARAEFTMRVPRVAMLLAALVIGLAIGYGVAFVVETRRPRIADVAEVERVTGARVIVHTGVPRAALALRPRRRSDAAVPAIIDTTSDSYQLLLVTLTGFGDATRAVRVLGDVPLLTAIVGINLAAAAAREARASLIIDGDLRARFVATLLELGQHAGIVESLTEPALLTSRVVPVSVGREQIVRALPAGGGAPHDAKTQPAEVRAAFETALSHLMDQEDFVVMLTSSEADVGAAWLPTADVILCARLGVTKLNWLTRTVIQLRTSGVRLRAVLLWAAPVPAPPPVSS